MHTVIRQYSGEGASELTDQIFSQAKGVEAAIRSVPGVISYALVRTSGGCISITICEDEVGSNKSVKVAAEFISKNCTVTANPPVVSEGETIIYFTT